MTDRLPENKLAHVAFPQPPDAAVKVWRYMNLAKFVWILANRKLWLSRVDLLGDPHEGSTPRALALARDDFYREHGAEQLLRQVPEINQNIRTSTYASCWHWGNNESEAMWRLYCPTGEGVAIQTTYEKLVDSIASDPYLYIGQVTYLDYETDGFPSNNLFYPVMHKRISFAHEQEVRLVKTFSEFWGLPTRIGPPGVVVDWEAEPLIEAVYIDPYAPDYYADVVRTLVSQLTPPLESRVRWSQMRAAPVY